MKLKMYLIPLSFVLACMIFAGITRLTHTDIGNGVYDYPYVADAKLAEVFTENKISSSKDIIKQADIIVKAKYSGDRVITSDAFYSKITVSHVYQGDKSIENTDIYIIEMAATFQDTKFVNASTTFLIPLQVGDEYILLLRHKKFDSDRNLNEFQRVQYYPVTGGAFGCYRISDKQQTEIMSVRKKYTLNSLKGMDIFTTDQGVLDTYLQYKKEIFKTIGA